MILTEHCKSPMPYPLDYHHVCNFWSLESGSMMYLYNSLWHSLCLGYPKLILCCMDFFYSNGREPAEFSWDIEMALEYITVYPVLMVFF